MPNIRKVNDITVENVKYINDLADICEVMAEHFREFPALATALKGIQENVHAFLTTGSLEKGLELSFKAAALEVAILALNPPSKELKDIFQRLGESLKTVQQNIPSFFPGLLMSNLIRGLLFVTYTADKLTRAFASAQNTLGIFEFFIDWKMKAIREPKNINFSELVEKIRVLSSIKDQSDPSAATQSIFPLYTFITMISGSIKWIADANLQKDNPDLQQQMIYAFEEVNKVVALIQQRIEHLPAEINMINGWMPGSTYKKQILQSQLAFCENWQKEYLALGLSIKDEQLFINGKMISQKPDVTLMAKQLHAATSYQDKNHWLGQLYKFSTKLTHQEHLSLLEFGTLTSQGKTSQFQEAFKNKTKEQQIARLCLMHLKTQDAPHDNEDIKLLNALWESKQTESAIPSQPIVALSTAAQAYAPSTSTATNSSSTRKKPDGCQIS